MGGGRERGVAGKQRREEEGRVAARGRAGGPTRRAEQRGGPELGLGEGAGESVGGRERQHSESAASQREGKAGRRGAEAGAGDRDRKAPRLGVSDQTDGKGWRRGDTESQAQRSDVEGGGGQGTRANEGSRSWEQSSGHRKRKRRWGCEGMKTAWRGEHPGGAPISAHVRAGTRARTRTHTHPGFKLHTHCHLSGLCVSSVGTRCLRPPPPEHPLSRPQEPKAQAPRPSLLPLWLSPYRPVGVVAAPRLRGPHWGGGRLSLLP